MSPKKLTLLLFLAFSYAVISAASALGQNEDEYDREENWLARYVNFHDARLLIRPDLYSKDDLNIFRQRLGNLTGRPDKGWAGTYFANGELSYSRLMWDSRDGFVDFYVYTCLPELRQINYGDVDEDEVSVTFVSQPMPGSPRKPSTKTFIKVIWGKHQFLVAESSLLSFAEKAAGLDIEPSANDDHTTEGEHSGYWGNYWVRGSESGEYRGLPEFPKAYSAFLRSPISATILSVKRARSLDDVSLRNRGYAAPANVYELVLQGGKDKGIREGMRFYNGNYDEIHIEHVTAKRSFGIFVRSLNERNKEDCWGSGFRVPCEPVRVGGRVKTRVGAL